MKVQIEYYYDPLAPHFWAKSTDEKGNVMCTSGGSWFDARKRHMEKLDRAANPVTPPPPEEYETEA